jgi:hypothetical protein
MRLSCPTFREFHVLRCGERVDFSGERLEWKIISTSPAKDVPVNFGLLIAQADARAE